MCYLPRNVPLDSIDVPSISCFLYSIVFIDLLYYLLVITFKASNGSFEASGADVPSRQRPFHDGHLTHGFKQ